VARKSAALLDDQPVKLNRLSRDFLVQLGKFEPTEGCEDAWNRYLKAAREHEEMVSRYDSVTAQVEREGGHPDCKSWPAFEALGKKVDARMQSAFGALDGYRHAAKHVNDKAKAIENEVRSLVIDSLDDKMDELQFSVNGGLLGSKIAQAIRDDVSDDSAGEPMFCSDCG
jgi:hypothetical protein